MAFLELLAAPTGALLVPTDLTSMMLQDRLLFLTVGTGARGRVLCIPVSSDHSYPLAILESKLAARIAGEAQIISGTKPRLAPSRPVALFIIETLCETLCQSRFRTKKEASTILVEALMYSNRLEPILARAYARNWLFAYQPIKVTRIVEGVEGRTSHALDLLDRLFADQFVLLYQHSLQHGSWRHG